jgi:mercuric ion transport protein
MDAQSEILMNETDDVGTKVATAGGVLGALAMTTCCILPLVLFSLGASGAWIGRLGAMYQYKWFFFVFAGASLAYGFWKVYQPAGKSCEEGAACARPINQRVMKIALWSSAALILTAILFPTFSPYLIGY